MRLLDAVSLTMNHYPLGRHIQQTCPFLVQYVWEYNDLRHSYYFQRYLFCKLAEAAFLSMITY